MFRRAERSMLPPVLGLCGPAGSGKTLSALRLAQGLCNESTGGKVALVDGEGGAARYAEAFGFDMLTLRPPHCPSRYAAALQEAWAGGYQVVILDGLSAVWSGGGGVLEQVETLRKAGHKAPWAGPGRALSALLANLRHPATPLVVTMRARTVRERGHRQPQPATVQPVQRPDVALLCTVLWQLTGGGSALPLRDTTGLFAPKQAVTLDPAVGLKLLAWSRGQESGISGLERALQSIANCTGAEELLALWGDWPEIWKAQPWRSVLEQAVAKRMRELLGGGPVH